MPSSVPPLLRLRMRKLERLLKQERDPVPLMQQLESRLFETRLVWELRTDSPEAFVEDLEHELTTRGMPYILSYPPLAELQTPEGLVEALITAVWDAIMAERNAKTTTEKAPTDGSHLVEGTWELILAIGDIIRSSGPSQSGTAATEKNH